MPPVAREHACGESREELLRQAKAQDQHLQRTIAQDGQRLSQIVDGPAQAEEGAVDDFKHPRGERGIVLQTLLEHARIEPRLTGEAQHFDGDGGQRIELTGPFDELLDEACGV